MFAPPGPLRASTDPLWPRPPRPHRHGRSYGLRFTLGLLRDGAQRTMLLLVPLLQDIGEAAAGTENDLIPSFVRNNYSFSFIHPFDPLGGIGGHFKKQPLKRRRPLPPALFHLLSPPRDSHSSAGFRSPLAAARARTCRPSARVPVCVCVYSIITESEKVCFR